MSPKRFILIPLILILLTLGALGGCGLKGDLYLPPADQGSADTEPEADDETRP